MEREPLTPQAVGRLWTACGATAWGPDAVEVTGIREKGLFSRTGVAARWTEVAGLLDQLPVEFRSRPAGGGGGWSFVNACYTRDDVLWTGDHAVMERLFMLGEAAGLVKPLFARELWPGLPGAMPYYVIELGGEFAVPEEEKIVDRA